MHIFTENGEYTFRYSDAAGNTGTATATVNWIDRTLPEATITFDVTELTNKDVTATITFNKENVTVTGGNTHTFTENGEYEFEFVGPAGNKGTAIAKVDWIDKVAPIATVSYSPSHATSWDVVATVTFDEENVTVTGGNTHIFTDNGSFTFEYMDAAGNTGSATAIVSWIDRIPPKPTITYDITEVTNKDVTATISFDEEISFLTEGFYPEELPNNTYRFIITDNTEFTLEFVDVLGNKGTAKIGVDWIDKTAPTATISYDVTGPTNQNVTATITFDEENVTVTGGNTHTFTENDEFTFEYVDAAGNTGTEKATVTWIDKVAPTATVTYDINELTNKDVTATITFNEENVTVKGGNTHTFTENDEFTFEYVDAAGNTGTATAKVNWIDKVAPTATITYDITEPTNRNVTATITFNEENVTVKGGNTHTFTENGEFKFEYVDKAGNTGTATAKVNWIDKVAPIATITYDVTKPTNQNVTATITFNEENVTVIGGNTHIFTENGEFTFEFVDAAGNKGNATAEVDWIKVNKVEMYRLYNPNSGEHFYTSDINEKNWLVSLSWDYEGIGWNAPETSSMPVYRLYNQDGGEHHYTTDIKEKNWLVSLGWTDEGIGWYSDDAQGVPLYRQYNPNAFANNHNYTTDKGENDWLVSLGWRAEGIGWYGVA